ncbi:S1C family serine protease [Acidisphaera sp. S103]|uniref:S1C family serine protease n=1 Tax=Acidisphaera sp. S103 TaxID=1747223 RepID=UPI00131DC4D8|nr:PDZ domain-containing protein [Acidisphaera sp. S103]
MSQALVTFSAAISRLVASAAPLLSAIRVGPNRHLTGLVCQGDTILTTDQALPILDSYTVVLSNRLLIAARPGPRDPGINLAVLRLETPWPAANPEVATSPVGSVAVVLGADADASPNVRLTVIHRFTRTAEGLAPELDLPGDSVDPGSLVLDPTGRLIGLAAPGPNKQAMAIPSALIGRMLTPNHAAAPSAIPALPSPSNRRGWLGVALQPITVPDQLVARAGQASGRMVVSITKGGPAEMAGVRIGDVLLALDGTSTSGPQALRAFLSGDRVGSTVEAKLLRDGNLVTTQLTIAVQPG